MTSATATISQYGDYIRGSDLIETQAIDNVLAETATVLGEQMGLTLDVIDRAVMIAGTNVLYHTTALSDTRTGAGSGCLLDAETIRRAVRTLKRANIKPAVAGKFIALIHPEIIGARSCEAMWKTLLNSGKVSLRQPRAKAKAACRD